MSDFYRYFKENMEALGLSAPESLFGTAKNAAETASLILAYIEKFGPRVTVGEMIGAGTKLEALATFSAMYASYYVGAVIGSLAVAAGRCLGRGASLTDVLATARRYDLDRPWLEPTMRRWRAIYDEGSLARNLTRSRMMMA